MQRRLLNRAFSLIELLTVVSIVALLASILFPAFAQAKREAGRASCASNLRQIGNCFAMYAADWDDYYPTAINSWDRENPELMTEFPRPWNTIPSITDCLVAYARSPALWSCPLDHLWFPLHGASYEVSDRRFFGKPQSQFNETEFQLAHDAYDWHSETQEWAGPNELQWRENELFGDGHVDYGRYSAFVSYQ